MTIKERAEHIANQGGYSADRYRDWAGVARMLLRRGYTDQEAEAIMRSKWTRWAADMSGQAYGRVTTSALAKFLDDPKQKCTKEEVVKMTVETFA